MCGDATPHVAMAELRRAFKPERLEVVEHRRGLCERTPERLRRHLLGFLQLASLSFSKFSSLFLV
jgi:hypothetical protein